MESYGVALGSDNERHHLNMFGSTRCSAEERWEMSDEFDVDNDDGEFELIDTGETDVTCARCLADD